jgi:hypothetical protein
MPSAFVLLQTEPGAIENIVDAISDLAQVASVHAVAGPYDAIVAVNGDMADIEPVRARLSGIGEVTRSVTCAAGSLRS